MALDIRGSLKNTRINKRPFVFIDELLANAIDSYLIRKNKNKTAVESLQVDFTIEFYKEGLYDDAPLNLKITCQDNGAGFGDEQVKAFTTKDTSYKDDLPIAGIGKCRGLGRIQFLHYFSKIRIESVCRRAEKASLRKLTIDTGTTKEIDEKSFDETETQSQDLHTQITLEGIKPEISRKFFVEKNLTDEFSVEALKQHVMLNFLQRFVGLKDSLGDFKITFKSIHQNEERPVSLMRSDLPQLTESKRLDIDHVDAEGHPTAKSETFTISHYKLEKSTFKLQSNLVALCAKSATVKSITRRYLTTKALENNDIGGFYHLILVESAYLDEHVNGTRDDFDIPENDQQTNLFINADISRERIYESIDDAIDRMISPPDWDKNKIVDAVSNKYGVTREMIAEAKVRIRSGDTEETIVKRVMATYQEKVIDATSAIVELKAELVKTDPTSDQFRDNVNQLAWKYTSSLHDIDMMNLSQLVVRRAAILEILHLAIAKALPAQGNRDKRCDEKFIHNILFPTGTDSNETKNHDIWLLNEEYQYFDYISSDKALSTIKWNGSTMFDATIDKDFASLLNRIYKGNADKRRPDIAIFGKEGAAIIIELKAPGVNLDEHVDDLMEYSVLLAMKSNGKLRRFYGYLLGDTLNPIRLRGYTRFPSNNGWFATEPVKDPENESRLGSLYSEILYYEDIVERASKRLEEYKRKIGLKLR